MSISIGVEHPFHSGIELLIEALNKEIDSLTPPETNQKLSVSDLDNNHTTVVVARYNDVAIACGALVRYNSTVGEIKRMYTDPDFRGRGISAAILDKLEEVAKLFGVKKLVLETGHNYFSARKLYEKKGWVECGPILDYTDNPYSVFYEKIL
jgi:putative acetyltransferase